jgi:Uncharacterised protein family (UPF0158)
MKIKLTDADYKRIGEELEGGLKVYIHKQSANIIALPDFGDFDDFDEDDENEGDDEANEVMNNPFDYFVIEKMESHDFFKVMANFAENMTDEKDRNFFMRVLEGQKPMANFNHHVQSSEYRQKWFVERRQAYTDYAKKEIEWLIEIEE